MFRHHGLTRTHSHNLVIASTLSWVAGFVNVIGFISVHYLTTNVTGHFAYVMNDVLELKWTEGLMYLLFIVSFFLGAFVSGMFVEWMLPRNERNMYLPSVTLEIILLATVAVFGEYLLEWSPQTIALLLLFSMGLQNSLVTKISSSVVRTTHLTGLFTDLGIEISQFIFYKSKEQRQALSSTIQLRARIILFFFLGGIIAGYLYVHLIFYALLFPVAILLYGLFYDYLRFKWIQLKNKL
ncbi:MAG: YoaK family protein [Flavobacterium sp.]